MIDWERLETVVTAAVRFLDNTIDLNRFPLDKVAAMTKSNRKIGLGVMGFADLLIKLGIPYNSDAAVEHAEKLMQFISEKAHLASQMLGKEKGSFANFDQSVWAMVKKVPAMRNAAVTTIAPTGYTSIVANCSSGIEPIFALAYRRQESLGGVDQYETNSLFEIVAKQRGFASPELMKKVADSGSIRELAEVPDEVKKVFVTAHDISPEWHIKIQAAFQRHVDNAVSKTINFPATATREDVARVYQLAYQLGCKGVTIYRDHSKDTQALSVGHRDQVATSDATLVPAVPEHKIAPKERPEHVSGSTYKLATSYGSLYVTINDDVEGRPFEVFATIGKAGGFFAAKSEAICRLVSLALRSGIEPEVVVDQIKGIRGPMPSWTKKGMILSIPDAIAHLLEEHISRDQQKLNLDFKKEETPPSTPSEVEPVPGPAVVETPDPQPEPASVTPPKKPTSIKMKRSIADAGFAPQCPDCGGILEFSEGCMICRACGYSKCS